MRQRSRTLAAIALCAGCLAGSPVLAGYSQYGLGMNAETGSVVNGALRVECVNNLWVPNTRQAEPIIAYENDFSGIVCEDYAKAWLVTAIYGATASNCAKITTSVNGHALAYQPTVGGTGDTNAKVFGSTVGLWVLSLPVDTSYLYRNGDANRVSVTISEKTQGAGADYPFDGRSYYQTLVTISQSASNHNILDYAFAVGGGDIGASAGYLASRTVNLGGISSGAISDADLYAVYTYGDQNQKDKLMLNGVSLLGDDVADKNDGAASPKYPADFVHAKVSASTLLATDNMLKFTVDAADFAAGVSRESSLRPELAVLGVTHAVPEPGAMVLVVTGVVVFGVARWRGSKSKEDSYGIL